MDDQSHYKTDAIKENEPLLQDRTVAALFSTPDQASQACDALKAEGYKSVDITQNTDATTADPKAAHEHGFWQGIKDFFMGHDDAHTYAEGVRRGNSLLTVHAEQGRAGRAVEIIQNFDPIDISGAEQAWQAQGWSRDAAKSAYLTSSQSDTDMGNVATFSDMDEHEIDDNATAAPVLPQEDGQVDAYDTDRVRTYARNPSLKGADYDAPSQELLADEDLQRLDDETYTLNSRDNAMDDTLAEEFNDIDRKASPDSDLDRKNI